MNDARGCPHPCGSWWEYDAQGIPLTKVCSLCRDDKLATYRPEILTGYTQADVDEPIEPEDPMETLAWMDRCTHGAYVTRNHPELGDQPWCPSCDDFVEL